MERDAAHKTSSIVGVVNGGSNRRSSDLRRTEQKKHEKRQKQRISTKMRWCYFFSSSLILPSDGDCIFRTLLYGMNKNKNEKKIKNNNIVLPVSRERLKHREVKKCREVRKVMVRFAVGRLSTMKEWRQARWYLAIDTDGHKKIKRVVVPITLMRLRLVDADHETLSHLRIDVYRQPASELINTQQLNNLNLCYSIRSNGLQLASLTVHKLAKYQQNWTLFHKSGSILLAR